jgi:hypothetical protein
MVRFEVNKPIADCQDESKKMCIGTQDNPGRVIHLTMIDC